MEDKVLEVKMLGGFEVSYGGVPIIEIDARNSMLTQLLQYLLCNRNKMIKQEELINVLLGEEDLHNPTVTLKNIVYRLRKLLVAGGIEEDCIIYKKGAYGFCTDMKCEIDTEIFAALTDKIINGGMSDDERMKLCFEALNMYKGEFLLKASGEPWVVSNSVRFQDMYIDVLKIAYELCVKTGAYARILPFLKKAAALYPYEEDVFLMHISCLYHMNYVKEAIAEYELVTAILFDDLGIGPSERLKELYAEITSSMHISADSIDEVRKKISEMMLEKGPFFCNLETFANIYQFAVRHMDRSGKSVFLMLCTLAEGDDERLKGGNRLKKIISSANEAIKLTCRRGDVYTRYSPSQFLLMLMEIRQENCDIVAGRLRRNFYKQPRMSKVKLNCRSISAADMDQIMEDDNGESERTWTK